VCRELVPAEYEVEQQYRNKVGARCLAAVLSCSLHNHPQQQQQQQQEQEQLFIDGAG
jgi:hypothetical protein